MSGRPTSRPDSLAGRALISVRISIGKQEGRRAVIHTAPLAQDRMGSYEAGADCGLFPRLEKRFQPKACARLIGDPFSRRMCAAPQATGSAVASLIQRNAHVRFR